MKKMLLMLATAAMIGCAGSGNSTSESETTLAVDSLADYELAEGVTVKSLDKTLTGEDVFKSIMANYEGKTVLVDFWATWCPPCRAAMKTIIPVKEAFAEHVTFVYITGPSSPEDTWKEMIADIHGDHYYVTEGQWNTLLDQFESEGIPTYVIVDKDGGVANKYIGFPGEEIINTELEALTK